MKFDTQCQVLARIVKGREDGFGCISARRAEIEVLPPSSWRQATVHRAMQVLCRTDSLFCGKTTAGQTVHRTVCLDRPFESALQIPIPNQKTQSVRTGFLVWWGRTDSNHRSDTQQIYSLSPLATRELPHIQLLFVGAGRRTRSIKERLGQALVGNAHPHCIKLFESD